MKTNPVGTAVLFSVFGSDRRFCEAAESLSKTVFGHGAIKAATVFTSIAEEQR
jgi:hypothetical protein